MNITDTDLLNILAANNVDANTIASVMDIDGTGTDKEPDVNIIIDHHDASTATGRFTVVKGRTYIEFKHVDTEAGTVQGFVRGNMAVVKVLGAKRTMTRV